MSVRNLTEGRPARLILGVAMPLMLGSVFQQLYTVMDAQIVGTVEGVSALAALGAADWFHFLCFSLLQGLGQGFSIPMAQAFGAGDYRQLRRCVGNAAVLCALCAAVFTGLAQISVLPVLRWMGTPDAIRTITAAYLRILFCGLPAVMGYNLLAGILRSLGDARSPLYAMVVASLLNIGLDWLFVAGFRWGVQGAAIATVIAQVCSCLFCLYRLSRVPFVRPAREDLRLNRAVAPRLMKLGMPMAFQNGVIGLGGMLVQSIVNTWGVLFIAGYTATSKLYGVLEIAGMSYGYAVSSYTGQNMGAGKPDRIRKGVHAALVIGILTSLGITLAMQFVGRWLVGSFISGTAEEVAQATQIGWEFLWLCSITLPILYVLHIYRSAQQGMGNTVLPLVSGLVEFVMRTASALWLPIWVGYWGVFWAEPLAWAGAVAVLVPSYYATYRRFVKSLH